MIDEREARIAIAAHQAYTGETPNIIYMPMPEIYIDGCRVIFQDPRFTIETKGERGRMFHKPRAPLKLINTGEK